MSTPYFLTGLSIFFLLSSHHYSWKYCLTDTVTPPHYFPTHIISKTIFTHTHTLFPYCFLDGPAFWLYMGILCGLLGNLVVPWSPGLYFWSRGRLQKSSHTWQSWQRCPFISYHHPKLFHSQLTQLTPLQRPLIPHHDLKPFHSLTNHTSHLHPYFMKTSLFQELLYFVLLKHTINLPHPFSHNSLPYFVKSSLVQESHYFVPLNNTINLTPIVLPVMSVSVIFVVVVGYVVGLLIVDCLFISSYKVLCW